MGKIMEIVLNSLIQLISFTVLNETKEQTKTPIAMSK